MNCFRRRARQAGFTLLEVMITVAIVGVLAAIALPSYNYYITRSKIIDGTVKLGNFRNQMEKWFLDNRTYQPVPAAGTACGVANPATFGNDAFAITCTANSATTYLILATGIAAKGMGGFQYRVDQTNAKTTLALPSGWTYPTPTNDCYAIRKEGTCQ